MSKLPPGQRHRDAALRQSPAHGCDSGGGRLPCRKHASGRRLAPDAQANGVATRDRGDIDVDPVGEQRSVSIIGPNRASSTASAIGYEEYDMRIADIDGSRISSSSQPTGIASVSIA